MNGIHRKPDGYPVLFFFRPFLISLRDIPLAEYIHEFLMLFEVLTAVDFRPSLFSHDTGVFRDIGPLSTAFSIIFITPFSRR